ncbi:sugar phosphate isomerase/epimerase [Telmatocola sphagniphila]|uniref:Sugar phosphate isomerase/epimerase n=1 Tax=Telmatocola sphagniphila TaxID=1123043 RepID=A0A8E6ETX0_9BACT|nr:sugar phosphate isomerase/epimerase family protein [Telmatocola sphagniphila]QVL32959.1 sugar phosphate isomerase/epimerase [Telmatocola sphagniphila]
MRYAICNETFTDWEHGRICDFIAGCGYGGLEIAPFTLAPLITDVSSERRSQLRSQAEMAGIQIIGLHWLLAKTNGFQLTSADPQVRINTGNYLAELAYACRDLGGDVLVLGSPQQRKIPEGASHEAAEVYAADTISYAFKALESSGVTLALEPLTPKETDFLQSAESAVKLAQRIGHPNVRLHLDVKAMASEQKPISQVIRDNAHWLKHFHANDENLRGPGFGEIDFKPIFQALKDVNYTGWVSVEVFDYTPDPETIARQSIEYMRSCE